MILRVIPDKSAIDPYCLQLVFIPMESTLSDEQNVNNVVILRQFVGSIKPIFEALNGSSSALLSEIRGVITHHFDDALLIRSSSAAQDSSIQYKT